MPSLELNNTTYTSNEERANLFGGILEQTFKDSNDDKFDKKFEIRIKNKVDDYKTKKIDSSFEKFTLNEINQELKKLKKRSAMGNDKIRRLIFN